MDNRIEKKLVAITFDDGPNVNTTPKVLDELEKYGVVASFFLIGQYLTEEVIPVVEREIKLGCEISNHSWTHSYMDQMEPQLIRKEVEDTSKRIKEMTGRTPAFFRPPYIAVKDEMYEAIDLPFISGINCLDWDEKVTAEQRVEMILSKVKDGDIILLHDFEGNVNTVAALEGIIKGLLEMDFTPVTISELFELKGVDPNVKYKLWSNTFE